MFNIAEKLTRFEPTQREKLKLEVVISSQDSRQIAEALHEGEAFIQLAMGGETPPRLRVKLYNGTKVYFQTVNHVLRRLGVSSVYKERGQLHHPQQVNQIDGSVWFEVKL